MKTSSWLLPIKPPPTLATLCLTIGILAGSCCQCPADTIPIDWFLEAPEGSGLGIHITGIVDTDTDTFTMDSFINDGAVTTYTPITPIVMEAVHTSGAPHDVPDTFSDEGIGDDWSFMGPLHALVPYSEGPTSGDGYHISWGGSEALTGLTVGQDERFFNVAISGVSSGTLITDKHTVSIPESTGLVLGGLGVMALLGLVMMQRE